MMNPNNLKKNNTYWSEAKHQYLIYSHSTRKRDGTQTHRFTDFGDLHHTLTTEQVRELTPRRN